MHRPAPRVPIGRHDALPGFRPAPAFGSPFLLASPSLPRGGGFPPDPRRGVYAAGRAAQRAGQAPEARGGGARSPTSAGPSPPRKAGGPSRWRCSRRNSPAPRSARSTPPSAAPGSDLGVFRLKHDVLDHKPDLLFVEFAVNDGGAPPEQIFRCMEGIVRQTWQAYPTATSASSTRSPRACSPDSGTGKFPRAASAMEKVADHYAIPSIHFGVEVARLAKQGKLVFKAPLPADRRGEAGDWATRSPFSPDGVHPYPQTGHELYLQSIRRSLPAIRAASAGPPAPHALKRPARGRQLRGGEDDPDRRGEALGPASGSWTPAADELAKRFGRRLPALSRADKPGESVIFRFKGRYAAVYDVIGPDCGQVIVTIDDQKPAVRPRFDAFCNYFRLATLPLGDGPAGRGAHGADRDRQGASRTRRRSWPSVTRRSTTPSASTAPRSTRGRSCWWGSWSAVDFGTTFGAPGSEPVVFSGGTCGRSDRPRIKKVVLRGFQARPGTNDPEPVAGAPSFSFRRPVPSRAKSR